MLYYVDGKWVNGLAVGVINRYFDLDSVSNIFSFDELSIMPYFIFVKDKGNSFSAPGSVGSDERKDAFYEAIAKSIDGWCRHGQEDCGFRRNFFCGNFRKNS